MSRRDNDRIALEACMKIARKNRSQQIDDRLASGEEWQSVARFACYGVQIAALRLKLWQTPPCMIDEDGDDEREAIARMLLRKMLKAGVSRFDPDPLRALERLT